MVSILENYDYEIKRRPGKVHGNADALSRHPCYTKNCLCCKRIEGKNVQHRNEKLLSTEKVSVCPVFENKKISKH